MSVSHMEYLFKTSSYTCITNLLKQVRCKPARLTNFLNWRHSGLCWWISLMLVWLESSWLQLHGEGLRLLLVCGAFECKTKKSLIGCWATTFGQSAPSRVQLTANSNGHNRHFDRPSLVSSVCRRVYTRKIELYVRVVGRVFPWRTSLVPTYGSEIRGFCMHGRDLASDRQGYFVKRPQKNTHMQQIYA